MSISFTAMRTPAAGAGVAALAIAFSSACSSPLGPQYEYEEQLYLTVGGAATAVVDTSIPALVALRGAALDPSPTARTDQTDVRKVFEVSGCPTVQVGQPWRRDGRRFVQIRIDTPDVRTLSQCSLLAWSSYTFERDPSGIHFEQRLGPAAGGNPGKVNWDGSELIAFKLHLPSKIIYHNVRRLADNSPGEIERGNILTWEQTLVDRRASKPIDMDVRMEATSILYRAIWLFGGSLVAAIVVLATIVWLVMLRGKRAAKNL